MMQGHGFIEVQGTAEGSPFARDSLNRLLDLAESGIETLFKRQREALGSPSPCGEPSASREPSGGGDRRQPMTDIISEMIDADVLRFGDFVLKSGRRAPFFFNLGSLSSGTAMRRLGNAYADCLATFDPLPEVIFGPAYKGISPSRRRSHSLGRTRHRHPLRPRPQGSQGPRRRWHAGGRVDDRPTGGDRRRRHLRRHRQDRGRPA